MGGAPPACRPHPPLFGQYRRATRDPSVAGAGIPGGLRCSRVGAAAHRHPKRFEDPQELRLDRESGGHLTFGVGSHACPGEPMARLELRLAERLKRPPDIGLVDPQSVRCRFVGGENACIEWLAATFAPAAR